MIIENNTNFELRLVWNRHLQQDVVEINQNGRWCFLGAIRLGMQHFDFGITSETTVENPLSRAPCDLQTAKTRFYLGCGDAF